MEYQLIRRPWGVDQPESWTLHHTPTAHLLAGPDGQRVALSNANDPRGMLEEIRHLAPDVLAVCSAHTTTIRASDDIRSWLPLFLHATAPAEPTADEEDWDDYNEYVDLLDEMLIGAQFDLMVHVDGEPWAVVPSEERRVVIPTEGKGASGLRATWATWSFVEQGSMSSGLDGAWIGELTESLGASHDRMDEVGSQWHVFPNADPARAVAEWLLNGWLIGEFRGTWGIESGSDPLIRGFIDMLAREAQSSEFFGADYATGDGIGLTDTAAWQIECGLDARNRASLLEALKVQH